MAFGRAYRAYTIITEKCNYLLFSEVMDVRRWNKSNVIYI